MATGAGIKLIALVSLACAPACVSVAQVPRTSATASSDPGTTKAAAAPQADGAIPSKIAQRPESPVGALARAEESAHEMPWDDAEILVRLAELEMDRGSLRPNAEGWDDFDRAHTALKRALLADAGYVPALNALAIYYLHRARLGQDRLSSSGGLQVPSFGASIDGPRRPATERLEMARRATHRATELQPRYAPAHNTAGLIELELGGTGAAIREFEKASALSPSYPEPLFNLAAVLLSIHDFEHAREAYRMGLALEPDRYDANLGLALAERGRIGLFNRDEQLALVKAHLSRCKMLEPERPETVFNEAVLIDEYEARLGGDRGVAAARRAVKLFDDFIMMTATEPEYAEALRIARRRSSSLRALLR